PRPIQLNGRFFYCVRSPTRVTNGTFLPSSSDPRGNRCPRLRPCLGEDHCTGSIGTTTPSAASTTSPASRHRSSRKRGARICTPGRRRPVVADRHRKRRNPQQRASVAMLKAGGKCSGFVRDRGSRSRPQMSSAKSAGVLTLARRYERRADYLLSKYAADDRGSEDHRGDEEQ